MGGQPYQLLLVIAWGIFPHILLVSKCQYLGFTLSRAMSVYRQFFIVGNNQQAILE
jgi:hypothetical protein